MLTFKQDHPPHGRILAYSSERMVGTIQPATKPVQWALDVPGQKTSGTAIHEARAKEKLAAAFEAWLKSAGLVRA